MTDLSNTSEKDSLQFRHLRLIDRLLQCPNGKEPEILNSEPDLLNEEFVQALMRAASYFAHHDNPDSAKFLVFIARELSHQLGLYQGLASSSNSAESQETEEIANASPDLVTGSAPDIAMAPEPSASNRSRLDVLF